MPSADRAVRRRLVAGLIAFCVAGSAVAQAKCDKPLYLTFDTGHMGVAPLIAEVLKRQDVRVTFFGAAKRALSDGYSMDSQCAPW